MSKIDDDFKKYSEYPEISGPMPYMDSIIPENNTKQVLQNMATAAQQKEQLLQDSAKRNQVDVNEIEDFLCENYLQEDSTEYLVDGAILTCTNSTSQEVWIEIRKGLERQYKVPDDVLLEEIKIPSTEPPKVLGCLKVTENPKAKDNDLCYATVCDSKAGDNIPCFGNCKRLPDSEWEMTKFKENNTGLEGSCKFLMRLESEWENFDIGTEYLQFTDDVHGDKSGITMTSILFCKHGGFIYPVTSGQVISREENYEMVFQYIDKDGNLVEAIWNISDAEFIDCNALTLEEIEKICNSHNPELVTRGFAEGIYNYCISCQLNPKVMLATLGQEQGWCKIGNYEKAFGVGIGGNPRNFSDSNEGIAVSCNVFIKKYNEGLSSSLVLSGINKDSGPNYPETKAVFGEGMEQWQNEHSKYVEYMENGQDITCVNAAMYAKLCYTPWVDFPPRNSHPLEDWLKIYNSLEECLEDD